MVVLMLTDGDAMPNVLAEVTGALHFVAREFAMLVAFNTVNGADKTRGRIDSHGEKLHDV
jgi:hypothetical protein